MSICRRCNRPLKREPWASQGIGKICSAKERIDSEKAAEETGDEIVPYDGGDIWIERKAAPTLSRTAMLGEGLSMMKHTASGIRTNVQRRIVKHSPAGFNFGYGGSGPSDFALNTLLMFTDQETAQQHYQDFKFQFVAAPGENDRLVITKAQIQQFLESKKVGELIS